MLQPCFPPVFSPNVLSYSWALRNTASTWNILFPLTSHCLTTLYPHLSLSSKEPSPLGSFPFPSDLGELLFYFLSVPCPWPSRRSITGCKKQTYSFMSLSRLEAPGGRGRVWSAKGAQYVNKWIKPLSPPLPTHQQAHHWVRLEVWKFSFVRLYHPWSLMPWNVATCSSTWLSLQVCGLLEGCGYVSFVLNSLVHSPGHACYTIHAPHTHTHTCSFCFIFSY